MCNVQRGAAVALHNSTWWKDDTTLSGRQTRNGTQSPMTDAVILHFSILVVTAFLMTDTTDWLKPHGPKSNRKELYFSAIRYTREWPNVTCPISFPNNLTQPKPTLHQKFQSIPIPSIHLIILGRGFNPWPNITFLPHNPPIWLAVSPPHISF